MDFDHHWPRNGVIGSDIQICSKPFEIHFLYKISIFDEYFLSVPKWGWEGYSGTKTRAVQNDLKHILVPTFLIFNEHFLLGTWGPKYI